MLFANIMRKNSTARMLGKKCLPWLVIALLCLPILLIRKVGTSTDETEYMAIGWNIARGLGPVGITGRIEAHHHPPMFPLLLAAIFRLTQLSVENALLIPKLFTCFNVLLVYLLGCQFSDRKAGLAGAIVASSSLYVHGFAARILLDSVQATFMLLSLTILILALEKQKQALFALSGVALGLGFLVKETALVWLPLPLTVALLDGNRRGLLGSLAYWVGFGLTVIWWWIYYFAERGQIFLAQRFHGGFNSMALPLAVLALLLIIASVILRRAQWRALLHRLIERLSPELKSYLMPALGLGTLVAVCIMLTVTLMPIGAPIHGFADVPDRILAMADYVKERIIVPGILPGYVLWGWLLVACQASVRRRSSGRLLLIPLLGLVLYSPLIFTMGAPTTGPFKARSLLTIIWLSYPVLGYLIVSVAEWITELSGALSRDLRWRSWVSKVTTVAVFIVLLWVRIGNGIAFYESNSGRDYRNSAGELNYAILDLGRWLNAHLPPGSRIMTTHMYRSSVYLVTRGRYPMHDQPAAIAGLSVVDAQARLVSSRHPDGTSNLLYVHMNGLWGGRGQDYLTVSADDLLADIREHQIDYLFAACRRGRIEFGELPPFFADHPAFEMVYRDEWQGSFLYVFKIQPALLPPGAAPNYRAAVWHDTMEFWFDQAGAPPASYSVRQLLEGLGGKPIQILPDTAEAVPLYEQLAEAYLPLDVNIAAFEYQQALLKDAALANRYLSVAQELTQEYSDHCGPWALLGDIYQALDWPVDAEAAYLTATQAPRTQPEVLAAAHRGLGQLHLDSGECEQAVQQFEQALQSSVFGAAETRRLVLVAQGNIHLAKGDTDQAILAYNKVLSDAECQPQQPLIAEGDRYLANGETDQAILTYDEALSDMAGLAQARSTTAALLGLVRAYEAQGRTEEAFARKVLLGLVLKHYENADSDYFHNAEFVDRSIIDTLRRYDVRYVVMGTASPLALQFRLLPSMFSRIHLRLLPSMFSRLFGTETYELYEVASDLQPNHAIAGNTYFVAGEWDEAIAEYEVALTLDPDDPLAHFGLGQVYQLQGELEKAVAELERVVAAIPDSAWLHLTLAQAYSDLGQQYADLGEMAKRDAQTYLQKAAEAYRCSWALDWENLAAGELLAETCEKLGGWCQRPGVLDEVVAHFERQAELDPEAVEWQLALALWYRFAGRYEEAEAACFSAADLRPEDADAYVALGAVYLAQDRLDDAEEEFERAMKLAEPVQGHETVARLYEQYGQLDTAAAYYLAAADAADGRMKAVLLGNVGRIYEADGRVDAAIAQYLVGAQAAGDSGTTQELYRSVTGMYLVAGHPEAARALVRSVLWIDRQDAASWSLAIRVYPDLIEWYESEGEAARARAMAWELLALAPRHRVALETLTSYEFIGNFPEAEVEGPQESVSRIRISEFTMPDTMDQRAVLLVYPGARLSYRLEVPSEPSVLRFGLALNPETWDLGGDGTTFKIDVRDEGGASRLLFSEHVGNDPEEHRWHDRDVTLASCAGQEVTITFATEPGPGGDFTGDEAGWATPRLMWAPAEEPDFWDLSEEEIFAADALKTSPELFTKLYPLE